MIWVYFRVEIKYSFFYLMIEKIDVGVCKVGKWWNFIWNLGFFVFLLDDDIYNFSSLFDRLVGTRSVLWGISV